MLVINTCFVLFALMISHIVYSQKIVVCYYGSWATYRTGLGQFDVEDINPNLCTHLVYTFVGITSNGTVVSLDPYLDLPDNWGRDNFGKFNALKQVNPNLKTLLAVGGWNEGSAKYSVMAANSTLRKNFIDSALKMVIDYGFNGFDVDWEYPNQRDTVHGVADIDNFTQLLKELREEFDNRGLMLTAAVSAVKDAASLSYDIPAISKYLDLVNIMTYDLYGAWDPVTGHNAGLHAGEGDEEVPPEDLYTVDQALNYWISEGCPRDKIVVGIPSYGRTYILSSADVHYVRAPASGAGISGPFTATAGFVGYNEFCDMLLTEKWTQLYDRLAKVPYAFKNNNWVSYDNAQSVTEKVKYSLRLDIAGAMVWSIETDDFNNVCGEGNYPLLKAINKALDDDGTTEIAVTQSTVSSAITTASTTTDRENDILTTTTVTSSIVPTTSSTSEATTTEINTSTTFAPSSIGFILVVIVFIGLINH